MSERGTASVPTIIGLPTGDAKLSMATPGQRERLHVPLQSFKAPFGSTGGILLWRSRR
jgi:hypothetical protein